MTLKIQAIHQDIDAKTKALSQATGLHCLSGCGACCEKPDIEVTVADVLPLAREILKQGKAAEVLAAIERNDPQGRCVFFQPDPHIKGHGHCGMYPYRPSLCRLFAFCATRDKHGKGALVTCAPIKVAFPQDVQKAQDHVRQGGAVPFLSDYAFQVMSADPVNGKTLQPINQAVDQALKQESLRQDLSTRSAQARATGPR